MITIAMYLSISFFAQDLTWVVNADDWRTINKIFAMYGLWCTAAIDWCLFLMRDRKK